MSLTEAFRLYASEYIRFRGLSRLTEDNYLQALNSLLKVVDVSLEELTFDHVRQWRDFMDVHGFSPGTIRGYLSKLKNVLKFTNRKGITNFDIELIQFPKMPKVLPKYVTAKEVFKMIEKTDDLRNKAIIATYFASGIRCTELSNLRRSDLRGYELLIQGKGSKERRAFIDDRSKLLIEKYLRDRKDKLQPLFLSRKKRSLTKCMLEMIIRDAGNKCNLSVTPHQLRHGYATNLLLNGCDIYSIKELLGHSDISTTQVYLHLTKPQLFHNYKQYHSI